ncbi:unnamed protein product [Thelazia callipaeda]|uniref:CCR4-NOT transcription complex subunit 10 n=1 Tax=Thelazia callipaeda TaxID=103827 RepID=A0A0N5CU07_THECL|nr:unnamed protein product [Thelazia callipaeda]
MSSFLLSRFETTDISFERVDLFDELLTATADSPDRLSPYISFIQSGFCDFSEAVRNGAYQCALNYISSNPSMAISFLNAYSIALLHKQADISLHALSFLPKFIILSRSVSKSLIAVASLAANRWPSPDSAAHLSRAIAAFRCTNLDSNADEQMSPMK